MSATRLSDIIDVDVFQDIPYVPSTVKTSILESGMIIQNENMNALANREGEEVNMPFWNDLADTEPNASSDDPSKSATPNNVKQGSQKARKAFLNNGWSSMDLASDLVMGDKPMSHIRKRVDAYWDRVWLYRLIASAQGIMNADLAGDSDMTVDVSAKADGVFSRDAFLEAAFTLGDSVSDISAIGVHSATYQVMLDNDDIEFIKDSSGTLMLPTYMGKRVIMSDSMPVSGNAEDGFNYNSVLFGNGAFASGEGTVNTPVEIDRKAEAGDGGGMETLWMRKNFLIHPFGFKFNFDDSDNRSPLLADLRNAKNWQRVVDRKHVPMAFLITSGKKKIVTPPSA